MNYLQFIKPDNFDTSRPFFIKGTNFYFIEALVKKTKKQVKMPIKRIDIPSSHTEEQALSDILTKDIFTDSILFVISGIDQKADKLYKAIKEATEYGDFVIVFSSQTSQKYANLFHQVECFNFSEEKPEHLINFVKKMSRTHKLSLSDSDVLKILDKTSNNLFLIDNFLSLLQFYGDYQTHGIQELVDSLAYETRERSTFAMLASLLTGDLTSFFANFMQLEEKDIRIFLATLRNTFFLMTKMHIFRRLTNREFCEQFRVSEGWFVSIHKYLSVFTLPQLYFLIDKLTEFATQFEDIREQSELFFIKLSKGGFNVT